MDPKLARLLSRVTAAWSHALAGSPAAREGLARRGLTDAALLERFQVGLSDGSLASMARGEVLEQLRLLGLIDESGRERFEGAVTVPVFDDNSNVVQVAAYDPDGKIRWLFDETPGWWNGGCLRHARDVLVVADPLAGLLEIQGSREGVIAPAGPGMTLGQGAKDALALHAPRVILKGCDHFRREIETLGLVIEGPSPGTVGRITEQDASGFTVELPRRIRIVVQGISQDSPRHLRASIKAFRKPEGDGPLRIHLDTLDLYHARSRLAFAKTAACLLGEDPSGMEAHLAEVISFAENFLRSQDSAAPTVVLTEAERAEALALLRDPALFDRVTDDLGRLGYVGEKENKLAAWLASLSRKLDDPLSILVLSRSAAGKSALAEAVAALVPPEDLLRFTRLTAQTLYYQKPEALVHKLVLLDEEEGVQDAAYALRILQSARKLSLSTASGKGDARTREVKGPASIFVTTTRTDLDEETAGRFVTLAVDESREQTRAILAAQREAETRDPSGREKVIRVHQNAQRLLVPVAIVNPYAPQLLFPDDRLSARRDHKKYLALIRAVAFARQHQRKAVEGAIAVTVEDIEFANRLANQVLGHSIYDLTPPSRRLLIEIRDWLLEGKEGVERKFGQRELRERVGWKKSQLAEHVRELVEAEYLVSQVVGPGRRTRYVLDWDGRGLDGERLMKGLADTTQLRSLDTSGPVPGQFRATSGNTKAPRRTKGRGPEADSRIDVHTSGKKGS